MGYDMLTDEELKIFCARFKTEEQVEKFSAAFQKGHDLIQAATGQVSDGMLQFGGGLAVAKGLLSICGLPADMAAWKYSFSVVLYLNNAIATLLLDLERQSLTHNYLCCHFSVLRPSRPLRTPKCAWEMKYE